MKIRHQLFAAASLLLAGCGGSDPTPAPVNRAPSISAIADRATTANSTSAAIAFAVADEQTSSLSITAGSDDQTVIPDSGIVQFGASASRSLTVTPAIDTLGDAMITVIVTDQAGLSASSSFLVTVVPQQESIRQFIRTTFAGGEADDPQPINAVVFDQDADDDDFADFLTQ